MIKEEQEMPNRGLRDEARKIPSEELAAMTAQQIMEQTGVTTTEAYRMRKEATAEVASQGASESLSHKILAILKNGTMDNVDELRSALFFAHEDLSASNTDITKAVWSLQKRNLVTFYERKHGRDSLVTKIKLTRNGATEMGVLPERHSLKPDKVKPTRELKHRSPVGKDPTDFQNQPAKTSGGPIERFKIEPATPASPLDSIKPDTRFLPRLSPAAHAGDPPRQNEKPEPKPVYPLIDELLSRAAKRESYGAAAKALEGIDDDMALELMTKIDMSAFEEEVIRYVRANKR